ncbi:MAG: 4Fe-4S binding protein [Acidobacteria bacterium]|nr:4Fe-4S binding protein [Acidobacteriota bacterium]
MNVRNYEMGKVVVDSFSTLTRTMRHRLFPGIFQWTVLLMLLFTAYAALFTSQVPTENFALVFVWIFWGTVAPISLWLFGRYWCAICPFHMLGKYLNKFFGQAKPIPRWVKRYGFWIALGLFVVIVWYEHAVNIFQSTILTLLLLVPVLIGAVVGALVYRNIEFWCRHLCPLLPIARNYSTVAMVEVRANEDMCEGCEVKACYRGDQSISGCPVGLYLRNLDSMQDCIACGQCFRACPTRGALGARFRRFLDEFRRLRFPWLEGATFAALWPGALAIHYFTLTPAGDAIMKSGMASIGASSYVLMWTLVYFAAILASLALVGGGTAVASAITGEKFKAAFSRYSYAFVPLGIGIHTAFNMPRFFGEQGLNRASHNLLAIFGYSLQAPVLVLGPGATRALMVALLAGGLLASVAALNYLWKSNGREYTRAATVPLLLVMAVIASVVLSLFNIMY